MSRAELAKLRQIIAPLHRDIWTSGQTWQRIKELEKAGAALLRWLDGGCEFEPEQEALFQEMEYERDSKDLLETHANRSND